MDLRDWNLTPPHPSVQQRDYHHRPIAALPSAEAKRLSSVTRGTRFVPVVGPYFTSRQNDKIYPHDMRLGLGKRGRFDQCRPGCLVNFDLSFAETALIKQAPGPRPSGE